MNLADPFAPLADTERTAAAQSPSKVEKVPITPVPDAAPPMNFKMPGRGAPVRVWEYRNRDGRLLGYDGRFEYEEGGRRLKDVVPITYCQVGEKQSWRSKGFTVPRPLYGLDRLEARPDAPVIIAEGAKSADAAGKLLPSYIAMSWPGGANAILQADWSELKGRNVTIWPDRDRHTTRAGDELPYSEQPGTIAAENIVSRLTGIAASIRVIDLKNFDCEDGWDADDALKEGWDAARTTAFIADHSREIGLDAPGTVLPFNFEHGPDGLYYVESENKRLHLCGRIKLLARTRDLGGSAWGKLYSWRDDDGVEHRWSMPMTMTAGDGNSIREAFLERGLYVSTDGKARQRLMEFVTRVDTDVRARSVSRVGWAGSAFALPHITIGDTPTDRVIFQNGDAGVHQYATAGSLAEWQEHVAKPAIGNSRVVFALCAAFVGPLLAPASEEGGGFNLVGGSSSGKTTSVRAAVSVWGPPEYLRTWRATGNGLEGVAAQHSETFLGLDELGQLEPREAGSVAYMLGNGVGKVRAGRSGTARAAAQWSVLYLSTGEVSLAELAREGKTARTPQAGQEVRILDLPADAGAGMGVFENIHSAESPQAFAKQIKTQAGRYYGTAAVQFLEELSARIADVGDMVTASIGEFVDRCVTNGSDGQVHRAARRFALVGAAGELATALGILPWPSGEADGAAEVMFRAWIKRRGGTGAAEDRNVIERLRAFIEMHGASRFSPTVEPEEGIPRPVLNRVGFYRSAIDDGDAVREYLILPEGFKEIFAGIDHALATKVLLREHILQPDNAGKGSQSITLPELGKRRCYVISAARLSDAD